MTTTKTSDLPQTGIEARRQCRDNTWTTPTSGIAPGHIQANLIILPSRYAKDFELLCIRNPVPCPLLACSAHPGDFENLISNVPGVPGCEMGMDIDVRTNAPRYNVYENGKLTEQGIESIEKYWKDQHHVAFLIGCSYSFENALMAAGLPPTHMLHGRSVPMYRSNIPLCPAGIFTGSTYVVSMRLYRVSEIENVRSITRPYVTTHGEPVAWGWDAMRGIGIQDINAFDWGEAPVDAEGQPVVQAKLEGELDGLVPVFWGCGVTPQEAVMKARIPGTVMGHMPGHMIVLDVKEQDLLFKSNLM